MTQLWQGWELIARTSGTEMPGDPHSARLWECPRCSAAVRDVRRGCHQDWHGRVDSGVEPGAGK